MRRRYQGLTSQNGELPSRDRWLLSYADFVTLLLAVFIVLFATSWHERRSLHTVSAAIHTGFESMSVNPPQHTPEIGESGTAGGQTPKGLQRTAPQVTPELTQQLQDVLGDAIIKKQIVMQQSPDGLVISLRELGFFNSGEASLLPGAAERLRATARVLNLHDLEVRVEGHSDDQPIHTATFRSNWELSAARAMSVLSPLLEGTGFPPERLSVTAYGPYHPVADNATAEGRRMNRRVDLVVIAAQKEESLR